MSSAVISCQQLLTADNSCYEKKLNVIFIHTPNVCCVPNFSFLGRISFSSAVISCQHLLTADESCYEQSLNGIFIYTLKVICVPNFSSLGWFSFSSAVNSCSTVDFFFESWVLIRVLKLVHMPSFRLIGLLGVRLESVTDGQTPPPPGEDRANSGTASLVPRPELSNWNTKILLVLCWIFIKNNSVQLTFGKNLLDLWYIRFVRLLQYNIYILLSTGQWVLNNNTGAVPAIKSKFS